MIPTVTDYYEDLSDDFVISELKEQPTFTYRLDYENDKMYGYVDNQEAMKQVIYKILNTERYNHVIYSDNYGVELRDLIGEHIAYVIPEAERRIREALIWDERITSVFDFEFDIGKKSVGITFKCNTIFGEVNIETEINY